MCLIAFAWRIHQCYPLALIANRDELHLRPSAAAGFDPEAAVVYGGRDLVRTWLASAQSGMADVDQAALMPLFDALADTTAAPDDLLPDTGVGLELERALLVTTTL
jgi:uncharacterized protein with NRDE domain